MSARKPPDRSVVRSKRQSSHKQKRSSAVQVNRGPRPSSLPFGNRTSHPYGKNQSSEMSTCGDARSRPGRQPTYWFRRSMGGIPGSICSNRWGGCTAMPLPVRGAMRLKYCAVCRPNSAAFVGEDDPAHPGPLYWWPLPPSEVLDPTWYDAMDPQASVRDQLARDEITQRLTILNHVLLPEVSSLVALLGPLLTQCCSARRKNCPTRNGLLSMPPGACRLLVSNLLKRQATNSRAIFARLSPA